MKAMPFSTRSAGWRRGGRGPRLTAAAAGAVLALAGCVTVDPDPGYRRTAELIRRHTAVGEVYSPHLADQAIRKAVQDMLEGGLTVEEAQRVAVLNNPSLQSLFHAVGVSTAELVDAGLLPNPSLSASTRFPENGEGLVNVTVGVSQSVIDLLLIPIRKRIAESNLRQAELSTAHQAVALVGKVKRDGYLILGLQHAERIAREDLALAERTVKLVQHRLEAGEADKLDVDLARAEALDVQRELLSIQRDLATAQAALAKRLGLSRWAGQWSVVGELPRPAILGDTDALVSLAMQRRLDARVALLRVEAARDEVEREKRSVFAEVAVGLERERADSAPNLSGPTVDVKVPLWHQNQALIARAALAVGVEQRAYEAVLDAVGQEVQTAAAARANARIVRFYEDQSLPLGRQNVQTAARAYEAGQHDILRLTDAQRSLIRQRRAYVSLLQEYATALADLEQAVGGRMDAAATQPASQPTSAPAAQPATQPPGSAPAAAPTSAPAGPKAR